MVVVGLRRESRGPGAPRAPAAPGVWIGKTARDETPPLNTRGGFRFPPKRSGSRTDARRARSRRARFFGAGPRAARVRYPSPHERRRRARQAPQGDAQGVRHRAHHLVRGRAHLPRVLLRDLPHPHRLDGPTLAAPTCSSPLPSPVSPARTLVRPQLPAHPHAGNTRAARPRHRPGHGVPMRPGSFPVGRPHRPQVQLAPPPQTLDVIVFKMPENPRENYISASSAFPTKTCCPSTAMPYSRPSRSRRGQGEGLLTTFATGWAIARKPRYIQDTVWWPLHGTEFTPQPRVRRACALPLARRGLGPRGTHDPRRVARPGPLVWDNHPPHRRVLAHNDPDGWAHACLSDERHTQRGGRALFAI